MTLSPMTFINVVAAASSHKIQVCLASQRYGYLVRLWKFQSVNYPLKRRILNPENLRYVPEQ